MVNRGMKTHSSIYGHQARNPRVTLVAAFTLAVALSVPVFIVLTVLDWLFL